MNQLSNFGSTIVSQLENTKPDGLFINDKILDSHIDSIKTELKNSSEQVLGSIQTISTQLETLSSKETPKGEIINGDFFDNIQNIVKTQTKESISEIQDTSQISLGVKLVKAGQYEDAQDIFQNLVSIYPDNHRAWNLLGITLNKLVLFEDAMRCFRNAIMLDSNNEKYQKNYENIVKKIEKQNRIEKRKNEYDSITVKEKGIWSFLEIFHR